MLFVCVNVLPGYLLKDLKSNVCFINYASGKQNHLVPSSPLIIVNQNFSGKKLKVKIPDLGIHIK